MKSHLESWTILSISAELRAPRMIAEAAASQATLHVDEERVEFLFGALFFFGARFFFLVGGWCRLELCHFCKLWQAKIRISAKFRVLQPNTPFGA